MAEIQGIICENIYISNDKEALTKAFTLRWIELINRCESNAKRC